MSKPQTHMDEVVWLHSFVNSAPDGCKWPVSRPGILASLPPFRRYQKNRKVGGLHSWYGRLQQSRISAPAFLSNNPITCTCSTHP